MIQDIMYRLRSRSILGMAMRPYTNGSLHESDMYSASRYTCRPKMQTIGKGMVTRHITHTCIIDSTYQKSEEIHSPMAGRGQQERWVAGRGGAGPALLVQADGVVWAVRNKQMQRMQPDPFSWIGSGERD